MSGIILNIPAMRLPSFVAFWNSRGRLIIFDPAMGILGRLVYGLFHHEPLALGDEIRWRAPDDFSPDDITYYAAQGNAERVFFSEVFRDYLSDWRMVRQSRFFSISYIASGGFVVRSFIPARSIRRCECWTGWRATSRQHLPRASLLS